MILFALVPSSAASAATQLVTFDDLAPGTTVATQFAAPAGVVGFPGPPDAGNQPVVRAEPGKAHSGNNVGDISTCAGSLSGCGENYNPPFTRGRLSTYASAVSAYVGLLSGSFNPASVTIVAYGANGMEVARSATAAVIPGGGFGQQITATAPSAEIASFDISAGSADSAAPIAFDDLRITTPDVAQPPDMAFATGNAVNEVTQGQAVQVPIQISRINGSHGNVSLSVTGLPTGMTATFSPNPIAGTDTVSTMTLTAADLAPTPVDYSTITITATPDATSGPAPRSITQLVRVRENCDRNIVFPYLDARAEGCLRRQGAHEHVAFNTPVHVDGLVLTPLQEIGGNGLGPLLTIDDQAKTVKSSRGTWTVAIDSSPDIPIFEGPIDWSLSGTNGQPKKVVGLDISGVKQLNDLPLSGIAVAFTESAKSQITPTVRLNFWPFTSLFGGLTASGQFTTDNDHGASFTALDLKLPDVEALGFGLKNTTFHWEPGGTWSGSTVFWPRFATSYGFGAAIGLAHGNLDHLYGSVTGINAAIGAGVYLQRIGFAVDLNPLKLRGTIGLSGGPAIAGKAAVTVTGNLTASFGDPFVIGVDGNAKVADRYNIGDAYLRYSSTGLFEFGGSVNLDLSILKVNGRVDGWVQGLQAFDIEGALNGCIDAYVTDICAGAKALISSVGVAGCVQIEGHGIGGGAKWTSSPPYLKDFDGFTGCDLGPWRAAKSAASGPPTRFTLPAGERSVLWELTGSGGTPPGVAIAGPHGERFTVDAANPVVRTASVTAALTPSGTTFVLVRRPSAGAWRLTGAGGAPITRVREARGLPAPRVRVRVTGSGRVRVLSWNLRPIPGQRVRFAEVGRDVRHLLGTTSATHGSIRFTAMDGPAGTRRILALVEERGAPRATLTVGSYRAPGPRRPARPRRIRLVRHSRTLRVSWSRGIGPFRTAVYLRVADGRRLLRVARVGRRSVTFGAVDRTLGASVLVAGITRANGQGPVTRSSIKARHATGAVR